MKRLHFQLGPLSKQLIARGLMELANTGLLGPPFLWRHGECFLRLLDGPLSLLG